MADNGINTQVKPDKLTELLKRLLPNNLPKTVGKMLNDSYACILEVPKYKEEMTQQIQEKMSQYQDLVPALKSTKVLEIAKEYAAELYKKSENEFMQMPDDKLHRYLQPFLGTNNTIAAIEILEKQYPELKGNEELQDKFIKELNKVPDEDKNYLVAMAMKIAFARNEVDKEGINFEHRELCNSFENVTTRLLKNFYDIADSSRKEGYGLFVVNKNKEINAMAFVIVFNDRIYKDIFSSIEETRRNMFQLSHSCGRPYEFIHLLDYTAKHSADKATDRFRGKTNSEQIISKNAKGYANG